MTLTGLLTFGAVYGVAVASPGPGVAAVLARVLARGLRGAPAFIAGFLVGDLVWFALAATALHALAQTFAVLFIVIRYAGAAYLLYLAWKLWTAPTAARDIAAEARTERP
ncbi:MAG TPA: LysE family transporter, partial [Candidatus Angelobacter sp.]|nr:LysE family transporter [Candidatus Angelobacter sp.]